jgi:carbamate kinase
VTQVAVDADDKAFKEPSKPIGSFMDETEAKRRQTELGWSVKEDAGRGWRRVVASPLPKEVVELEAVQTLIKAGTVVVTVGGGGIPVIRKADGELQGVAAVIDKDFASSLLARLIHADLLLISTAVEKVAINFGKPEQKWLDKMTLAEAKAYLAEGTHFAKGSMAPKIQAVIWFLENGGKQALITNPENIGRAIKGETGTLIVP